MRIAGYKIIYWLIISIIISPLFAWLTLCSRRAYGKSYGKGGFSRRIVIKVIDQFFLGQLLRFCTPRWPYRRCHVSSFDSLLLFTAALACSLWLWQLRWYKHSTLVATGITVFESNISHPVSVHLTTFPAFAAFHMLNRLCDKSGVYRNSCSLHLVALPPTDVNSNTTVPHPVASTAYPSPSVTSIGCFILWNSSNSLSQQMWIHDPFIQTTSGTRRQHVVNHQTNTITIWTTAVSSPHFSPIHPHLGTSRLFFIWATFAFVPLAAIRPDVAKFPTVMALESLSFRSLFPSHRSFSSCIRDHSFGQFPFFMQQTILLGTSSFASKAVTNILYDSGKLVSKCTTRSSSGIQCRISNHWQPIKNLGHSYVAGQNHPPWASKKRFYASIATC